MMKQHYVGEGMYASSARLSTVGVVATSLFAIYGLQAETAIEAKQPSTTEISYSNLEQVMVGLAKEGGMVTGRKFEVSPQKKHQASFTTANSVDMLCTKVTYAKGDGKRVKDHYTVEFIGEQDHTSIHYVVHFRYTSKTVVSPIYGQVTRGVLLPEAMSDKYLSSIALDAQTALLKTLKSMLDARVGKEPLIKKRKKRWRHLRKEKIPRKPAMPVTLSPPVAQVRRRTMHTIRSGPAHQQAEKGV